MADVRDHPDGSAEKERNPTANDKIVEQSIPDDTTQITVQTNLSERQKRLFQIQLKMNQGRKLNKIEVENEYKRLTDPKYKGKSDDHSNVNVVDVDNNNNNSRNNSDDGPKRKNKKSYLNKDVMLNTSSIDSLSWKEKQDEKERNRMTSGWQAFASNAVFKAYDKRASKLAVRDDSDTFDEKTKYADSVASLQDQLLMGGMSSVSQSDERSKESSKIALDRLGRELEEKEKERQKFSRRRMHFDANDVDYINEDNAYFNKKIKRAFDKYTVEIRQNLERGTAV